MEIRVLQEQLKGTYDLTDLVDCQSVIGMLLQEIETQQRRTKTVDGKLKILAAHVTKGRDGAAMTFAQKALEETHVRDGAEVMDSLLKMSEDMADVETLDDETLVTETTNKVWGDLPFTSRESALVEELISRFKKNAGIEDVVADKVP